MVLLNSIALGLLCLSAHACAAQLLPPWLGKGQSRTPVPISKGLYREFQIYTNYSVASKNSKANCPHPPYGSVIVNYFSIEKSDTQATIFRHDPTKEFIIAFPGTQSKKDAHADQEAKLVPFVTIGVTEKNCKGCKVHQGFYREWQSISKSVSTAIHYHHKLNPSYKIVVTGHSLGASLASLCTASLRAQGLKFKTFTFGEPRTGNKAYANHIDKISGATAEKAGRYYRVTHANDGVPKVPARSFGYQHSRTEYWETDTLSGGQSAATTFRCFGQEPDNCNNGTKGKVGVNAAHGEYSGLHYNGDEACGV